MLAREANAWVVHLTSGQATEADAAALRQWCAQSPEHAAAYREATRVWRQVGQLTVPRRRPRRRLLAAGAMAACLTFLAMGTTLLGVVPDARAMLADHHTRRGEQKDVKWADGSFAELDASTRLNADWSAVERRLELSDGAAVFHVQPDASRPFVVRAGSLSVTAVGTVFEVRYLAEGVSVTCSEGVVAVSDDAGETRLLKAGEQLTYSDKGLTATQRIDSEQALAWRSGSLVFRNRPLQELVYELNRYHRGRILITREEIARMPVSGVFHLDRAEEALRHIEQTLALSATRLPAGIIVLR